MQEETKNWLKYAEENLDAARVLLNSELFNPCLHNVQQCIEKALKSIIIEKNIPFKKTHNIFELKIILYKNGIAIEMSDDDCDFLDSIYLPTKYPVGSALPFYYPEKNDCLKSIKMAETLLHQIANILK
ncbi:MAG TPA: HEPN domain-containing protein [Ignavibacteriaceae bacterium]|nr:HEPN domain-containing protein [Ignavibacteriaceae bacterium]HRN26795.1 HEPN domain-containing protein [Ignavibacteriaceae bacterium]HRP94124.1 HEPN domain-containing protein [Ignavibacteriaceae bacterium]HRQ54905.1 HEPN domain-containing protein [Ignavibacteriaceae bacterium]